MKQKYSQRLTISLTDDQYKKLTQLALVREVPLVVIIREALKEYLDVMCDGTD